MRHQQANYMTEKEIEREGACAGISQCTLFVRLRGGKTHGDYGDAIKYS